MDPAWNAWNTFIPTWQQLGAGGAGGGGETLTFNFVGGTVPKGIGFVRAGSKEQEFPAGTVTALGVNVPSVEVPGLLVEAPHTNQVTFSQSMGSWNTSGVGVAPPTIIANTAVAPDGTTTAAALVFPAVNTTVTNEESYVFSPFISTPGGTSYTESIWIKGASGSGTIYLYWYDGTFLPGVACAYNSTTWTRFQVSAPVAGASLFGIRVGVSANWGHASQPAQTIYVWGAELDAASVGAMSYIPTTTAPVTGAGDTVHIANVGLPSSGSMTLNMTLRSTQNADMFMVDTRPASNNNGPGFSIEWSAGVCVFGMGDGTSWDTSSAGWTWTPGVPRKVTINWTPTSGSVYLDGALVVSAATPHNITGARDIFLLGRNDSSLPRNSNAWISEFTSSGSILTGLVCMGDSITQGGIGDVTNPYPQQVGVTEGPGWNVQNAGLGGDTTTQMVARWESIYVNENSAYLSVLGGINDFLTGGSVATAYANITQMANEALANGQKVRLLTTLPCTSGGTTVQADITSLNSMLVTYAAAHPGVVVIVDTNTALAQPGFPNNLNPIYDHGDGIHPNQAGTNVIAALLAASLP